MTPADIPLSAPILEYRFTMQRLLTQIMLGVLPLATLAAQKEVGWEVGNFVPELELPTIDGQQTVRLSEFRGERVLLIQFASW